MSAADGHETSYPRIAMANVAARQCVMRTGEPVTLRIYDVKGTSKVLRRRIRVLRKLDGSIGIASA